MWAFTTPDLRLTFKVASEYHPAKMIQPTKYSTNTNTCPILSWRVIWTSYVKSGSISWITGFSKMFTMNSYVKISRSGHHTLSTSLRRRRSSQFTIQWQPARLKFKLQNIWTALHFNSLSKTSIKKPSKFYQTLSIRRLKEYQMKKRLDSFWLRHKIK